MGNNMKNGIKAIAEDALDIKDDLCLQFMNAGLSPEHALLASTIATKGNMDKIINKHLNKDEQNHNAAQITSGLKNSSNLN